MTIPGFLVFLTRGNIAFFEPSSNFSKNLPIPEKVVKDLEVIDENALTVLITTFLGKEKIYSRESIILLSESVCFSRENPYKDEDRRRTFVQDFTDSIPLEVPEVKAFKLDSSEKVVAVNGRYYRAIMAAMLEKGFRVIGVLPASLIKEVGVTNSITIETARKTLDSYEKIKFQNFLDITAEIAPVTKPIITTEKPKGNRIYILVGVFAVGLIILLAMLFLRK